MTDPFRDLERALHRGLRPRRQNTAGVLLAALVLFVGAACLYGWIFMLAIGILSSHSVVGGTLPFWDAVLAGGLFSFLASSSVAVGSKRS